MKNKTSYTVLTVLALIGTAYAGGDEQSLVAIDPIMATQAEQARMIDLALAQAVKDRDLHSCQRLLAAGAHANGYDEHGTPILALAFTQENPVTTTAITFGPPFNQDIVRLLRQYGADLRAQDMLGRSIQTCISNRDQ